MDATITQSYLWASFEVVRLTENLRILHGNYPWDERRDREHFAKYMLDVGNGIATSSGVGSSGPPQDIMTMLDLPPELCVPYSMTSIVHAIYGDLHNRCVC